MKINLLIGNQPWKSESLCFYALPVTVSYRELKRKTDCFGTGNVMHYEGKPYIIENIVLESAKVVSIWVRQIEHISEGGRR